LDVGVGVKRSLGKLSKRSRLLRKRVGDAMPISTFLRKFEVGAKVHVAPRHLRSMPHPRYRGKTGVVVGRQGGAYVVELNVYNARKRLVIEGAHLQKA